MKIYKENIERCEKFYNSDFYNELKNSNNITDVDFVKGVFTRLCLDADACDEELYKELGKKFGLLHKKNVLIDYVDNQEIKLASDIICGRKQLVKLRDNEYCDWVKDYERIGSNLDYHFIWPRHKLPTINTYRYQVYLDRIDCLLYDFKMYFSGEKTPMDKAYKNETTKLWLTKFKNFEDFISKMKLERFVDDKYEVFDLSKNDGSTISSYIRGKELVDSIPTYLINILKKN
ncbi:DUF6994 family protein [Gemella cuniculi]|uniref:DUF6994 family protein n=1 Tax=Gemella cuniculi TaxID=150240 RepID=UPI00041E4A9C|nr:hypothetical protein [Gemella cuniculi]